MTRRGLSTGRGETDGKQDQGHTAEGRSAGGGSRECVLFWALDRFSREGMAQTIVHLQRLTSYGVTFHSYSEPRNILLALLASLAKVEAQKIGERTKAGMARAKAKGIRVGRPRLAVEIRQQIAKRAAKGETPYSIAKALGVDRHTVAKYAG